MSTIPKPANPPPPPWGLIADDLTGACDAAAPFADRGFPVKVLLGHDPEQISRAGLTAISTGSRDIPPEAAAERVGAVCDSLKQQGVHILYKKIDSVLRGNITEEVDALLKAAGFAKAVLTPAFPTMGRVVRDGKLFVSSQPDFTPIDLRERFLTLPSVHIADAANDTDLAAIVETALRSNPVPQLVGSAGLAASLASYLASSFRIQSSTPPPPNCDAALFIIGTPHPTTTRQLDYLIGQRETTIRDLDSFVPDATALASSRLVIRVGWENPSAGQCVPVFNWLESYPLAGIVLSGGDTAAFFCEEAGASAIELRGQAFPGIPWGILHRGQAAGRIVITKSGGFGAPPALAEIDDFLRQSGERS